MKRSFLLLVITAFIIGCSSIPTALNNTTNSLDMDYSFLALGDSYTIGESVGEQDRWPVQLVEELNRRGYKVAAPKIVAGTGWTTGNLVRAMNSELPVQRDFDLVSILIGVNNQYQGTDISEYETQLRTVFRKAINHSKRRERGVFALSIPDYGATPFGTDNAEEIAREIDAYNAVVRRVAEDKGVAFFNITPISREAVRDKGLIAKDSLHPSPNMYRFWVLEIVDDVAGKLPE